MYASSGGGSLAWVVEVAAGRSLPEPCYFGDCPFCGGTDGYMNIGRVHWFVCRKHRLKWCAGSNLFSSWREEDEMTWECNARRIASYREVEPWYRDSLGKE